MKNLSKTKKTHVKGLDFDMACALSCWLGILFKLYRNGADKKVRKKNSEKVGPLN